VGPLVCHGILGGVGLVVNLITHKSNMGWVFKEDLAAIFKHKAKTSDDAETSSAILSVTWIQEAE